MSEPLVDFSVGLTDPASFPTEAFAEAASRAVLETGSDFVFYPGTLGHPGLRSLLAEREAHREGIEVQADQIALTNGSMQAVTLVGRVLLEARGDVIVTEELTYSGTINAYKGLGAELVGVPVDEHGMRIDELDATLARLTAAGTPARFVYTLPTYQNPTGAVMPVERRRALLEVARRHQVLVVEDNCYGDVHFDGEVPPSIYSLAEPGEVLYIGSLSKILAAGVRLGYLMAPTPLLARFSDMRFDAGHSVLSASVLAAFLGEGRLWQHIALHNRNLVAKRDALVAALESELGGLCRWTVPVGGLFLWLHLPEEIDRDTLAATGEQRGVLYGRGSNFHVHGDDVPALRLAFGYPTVEEIGIGVTRLADSIRACVPEAARASA
jgi:2-aminoadipate transaminase